MFRINVTSACHKVPHRPPFIRPTLLCPHSPLCNCSTISGAGSFCAAVSGIIEFRWVDVLKQLAVGEYQGGFVLQRRQYARQCNICRHDVHSKHGSSQTVAARYGLAAQRLCEALRCQRNAASGHSAVDAGARRSRCLDSCYQSTDSPMNSDQPQITHAADSQHLDSVSIYIYPIYIYPIYIYPSFRPACTAAADAWLSLISVVKGVKNPGLYYIRLYCLTLTGSHRTNSTCGLSQLYEIKYWEEKQPFAQNLQYSLRSAPNQAGKVAID